MTAEEIVVAALARAMEFTDAFPQTRSVLYRRIGVRQQQLFARAARLNPDYFGICAVGTVVDGAVDLADLIAPLEAVETITRVEIADKGMSSYAAGREVAIVPSMDAVSSALPPRATLRNRVLRGVKTDLDGVVSLRVHYSRVPLAYGPADGARAVELPEPHTEMLVVDLARECVRKAATKLPDLAPVVALLDTEEAGLVDAWDRHVRDFAVAQSARFGAR